MKVLMIGGTGTISYDATKYFLKCGHDVFLLNRGNRNDLQHKNLHFIIGDANNKEELKKALEGKHFNVIFDFIIFSKNQMEQRLDVYNGKCEQFFFISSSTAYKLVAGVITEETPLENLNWKYSRDKIECETYLKSNEGKWSFNYTIIRPYITYDNRRLPFPVITKASYYSLINRIISNKPVIICGDGNNKLTLTHTKDFAIALEGLIMNPKAMNQAFHITGDCVTTWNEILEVICKSLNKKAQVVYIQIQELAELFPAEKDELLYDKSCDHVFDNTKIKDAVPAFVTTLTVEQGISDTVRNLTMNNNLKKIDSIWDDTIDVIIEAYQKRNGNVINKASMRSKAIYYIFQESNLSFLKRIISKIHRIRGKVR